MTTYADDKHLAMMEFGCASGDRRAIHVLALMEATSTTGPAKNLIEFAIRASQPHPGSPKLILTIVTFQRGKSENPFVAAAKRAGLEVIVVRERFAFDPSILSQLRRVVFSRHPEVVQTHNFKSHFLIRFLGLHKNFRWIAFFHGYTWTDLKNYAYNLLDLWSLRSAHRVVTVCQPFAAYLNRIGVRSERIFVQHNAVRPIQPPSSHQVVELRRNLAIPPGTLVLLAVGRLSREKGHIDVIEALAIINRNSRHRRFRLVLVGDGPERGRISKRAKSLRVADKLILAGHQSALAPFYDMADVLVLPSHTEGSPNVLLEAMAAGLPAVVTSVGGVPEIAVQGFTALVVQKNSPAELATAMVRLLDDEELRRRLGAGARSEAVKYDPESYYCSLLQVYRGLLAEKFPIGGST